MVAAFNGSAIASDIYKWTDAAGNVHYGDRPSEDIAAERLDIKSRPTDRTQLAAAAPSRSDFRRQAPLVAPGADDNAAPKKAEPSPEELRAKAQERAAKCDQYKERLQTFVQSRRLYRQDENGERVYLNDEETLAARAKTQEKVEEYCKP
jgi:hypothetical protein